MSTATPIKPASDPPPALAPREWRLRLDPLLLLAAVGLVACSSIAIKGSTADDVPGDPLYYFERQVVYGAVGIVLMYAISRVDYSRLRELKYVLYGFLIGSIVLVFGLATATPQRVTEFPDIPTSAEVGVPNWIVSTWYGLWAIKGTPQPLVDRMYAETVKAMKAFSPI